MRGEVWVVGLMLLVSVGAGAQRTGARKVAPYASIAAEGERYAGPGRAAANDLAGKVVRIGLLAPLRGAQKAEGEAMVAAAEMALRDAGGEALPGGRRVALAVRDESGPSWGAVSDAVIELVMEEEVVAVITSSSGVDAHLCEQVGNRLGVPVLTLAADATTTQIDIPWIFRIGGSDVAEARVMAQEMYGKRGLSKVMVVTMRDHDGLRGVEAMKAAAEAMGAGAAEVVTMDPQRPEVAEVVKRMTAEATEAVVIWTGAEMAGSLLRAMKAAGVKAFCFLPEDAAEAGYGLRDLSGEGVWTVGGDGEDGVVRGDFWRRYAQSTGTAPSVAAMQTYDAVTVTVRALRSAGANRARVRDELAKVQGFEGAAGRLSFDREGNNVTALHLVRLGEVHE
jgi:branched-chain amino acid transport system substrate-binding protein